jgi:hypothetical protein
VVTRGGAWELLMVVQTKTGRPAAFTLLLRLIRVLLIGLFSGFVAGSIVGGIGSRAAMRILAALNADQAGVLTENGNIAGHITAGGTLELLFISGAFPGAFGGLLYVAIRRWLPWQGRWKRLAFGIFLFLAFGSVVIDGDNKDFALFGPPALAVSLFALLFPLYGLAVASIVDRIHPYVPPPPARRIAADTAYVLLAGVAAFGLFQTVGSIKSMG